MVLKRGHPTTNHTPQKNNNTGARPVGDTCQGKDAASHNAAAFRGKGTHTHGSCCCCRPHRRAGGRRLGVGGGGGGGRWRLLGTGGPQPV